MRKRAILTDNQASEIAQLKNALSPSDMNHSSFTAASIRVSTMYGVSPKAVRVSLKKGASAHPQHFFCVVMFLYRTSGMAEHGDIFKATNLRF